MSLDYKNKSIAVVGLGRSGLAVAEYMLKHAKKIILADQKETAAVPDKFKKAKNVELMLGKDYLKALDKSEIAFISPGIDRRHLKKSRAKLSSEIDLLFSSIDNKIVGVTGSNGKSTVVTLIHHILDKAKLPNILGGNIGNALIEDINGIKKDDVVTLELSSFQLEFLETSPNVAVVLNVTTNHLDRHGSMAKYIQAKANIVAHQTPKDIAILNAEDPQVLALAKKTRAKKVFINLGKPVADSYFFKAGTIYFTDGKEEHEICSIEGWQLPGKHNLSNLLAAVAVADALGVKKSALEQGIKTFKGLEHRIELAGSKRGVSYYNDSKATTPEATIAAMNSFGRKIILICGGSDKDLDFYSLAQNIPRQAKKLILMGETGPKIAKELKKHFPDYTENIVECFGQDMLSCVRKAQHFAENGDMVLLSPASASFDSYANFEERGREFKKIIAKL